MRYKQRLPLNLFELYYRLLNRAKVRVSGFFCLLSFSHYDKDEILQ